MTSAPRLARRRPKSRPAGPPPTMHAAVRVAVMRMPAPAAGPRMLRPRRRLGARRAAREIWRGGHAQVHGNAEGAADAATLGRLAKPGHLGLVDDTLDDQFGIDGDDAPLGLRRLQARLESSDRPLSAFGE